MQYYNPFPLFQDPVRLERDVRYMKQYYPELLLRLSAVVTDVVDQYDTVNSFLYDAFPDRISTLHILKEILDTASLQGIWEETSAAENNSAPAASNRKDFRTMLAELLLSQEILLRRQSRWQTGGMIYPVPSVRLP